MKRTTKKPVRLSTLLRNNNLITLGQVREFLMGKQIRVVTNSNSHNYTVGDLYTIDEGCTLNTAGVTGLLTSSGFGGNTLSFNDCELVENSLSALEYAKESRLLTIKKLKGELVSIEEKLTYLTETKKDVLDDKAYAEHKLEKLLADTTLSTKAKMAAISDLYLA